MTSYVEANCISDIQNWSLEYVKERSCNLDKWIDVSTYYYNITFLKAESMKKKHCKMAAWSYIADQKRYFCKKKSLS